MRTLVAIIILTWCLRIDAAVINAADGSFVAVSNAIFSSVDRDEVRVPANQRFNWTNTMVITKGIWLNAPDGTITTDFATKSYSGTNSVIISNGVPNVGVHNHLISWTIPAGETGRLSGFQFTTGNVPSHASAMLNFAMNGKGDASRMRIDHNHFQNYGVPEGSIWLFDSCVGVFDHNVVDTMGAPAWGGYCKGNNWTTAGTDYLFGDGEWAAGPLFGTDTFMTFEDNFFTNRYALAHITLMDAQAGAKYRFRHNPIYKGSFESHGLEAQRERSGRAFEIYYNTLDGIDTGENVIYFRGASGVVYSNYVFGYGNPKLYLLNNRLADSLAAPFGGADGRNPWDSNNLSSPFVVGTCSSAGTLTMTDSGKSWTVNQYQGYAIRKTGGSGTVKTVSSVTRSGSTVTVSCTGHGLTNGAYISLWNCAQQAYNGIYICVSNNANQFQVNNDFSPDSPATVGGSGGSILACAGNFFSEITANTATQITFKDSIYTGGGGALEGIRMVFAAGDTYEINLIVDAMDQPGMGAGPGPYVSGTAPTIPSAWPSQPPDPWYEWQNIKCTAGPAAIGAAGTGFDFAPIPLRTIVNGRHFTNDTVRPGYTEFVYPHPLVSGASCSTPPAPSALTATTISSVQINLGWTDNAIDEDGFEVDRALDSGFTSSLVTVGGVAANAVSYNYGGLSPSTQYFFRVRATNECGASSYSSSANATTDGNGAQGSLGTGKPLFRGRARGL